MQSREQATRDKIWCIKKQTLKQGQCISRQNLALQIQWSKQGKEGCKSEVGYGIHGILHTEYILFSAMSPYASLRRKILA